MSVILVVNLIICERLSSEETSATASWSGPLFNMLQFKNKNRFVQSESFDIIRLEKIFKAR